jgi:FkbM family methyltransferase
MSRLVGPRGLVCAFEASRRIIDKTHWNLVQAGCSNVQLLHRAVFSRSNEIVTIYPGSHLNDSLIASNGVEGGTGFDVVTVALDDFIAYGGLVPSVVKMDIEGAEHDALLGAGRMISEIRPALILEQSPSDMRCHALLTAARYRAVDLATYRPIRTAEDFAQGVGIANILFLHETAAATSPYFNTAPTVEIARLPSDRFATTDANGSRHLAEPLVLPPGRYMIDVDFSAAGTDNEMFIGIDGPGRPLFRYHAYSALLAGSYRQWVVSLDRAMPVTIYFRLIKGVDPSFRLTSATIHRLTAFDGLAAPLYD